MASAQPANTVSPRDLATLRDMEGLSVSPDGAWAAFQIRQADPDANRYSFEWFVVPTAGGAARRIADGGEPMFAYIGGYKSRLASASPPIWSPDSTWIVYLRQDDGLTQIWRTRHAGRRTEQITRNDGDVVRMLYSRDGRRLLFETRPSLAQRDAALEAEGRTGFLYDDRFLPGHSRKPVAAPGAATTTNVAARIEARDRVNRIWAYEFERKRERPANAAEQAEFAQLTLGSQPSGENMFGSPRAANGAGPAAWLDARDPERQGLRPPRTLVARRPGAEEVIVCTAPECTGQRIGGLRWRGENEIIFDRREGPAFADTAFYSWRPGPEAPRRILQTPNRLDDCAVAGSRLICFYEQPDYPRRLAAVDLDTGAVDILYDPNPEFARLELGPAPERLTVRTPSGTEAFGYLVRPPGADSTARLPLIIVTYRCSGFLRGATGDEYPIYPFASQGFATLCLDLPLENYELRAHAKVVEYYRSEFGPGVPVKRRVQESVDAAVNQLDAMKVIDPDRVGLTGLSGGAQTVLYALSHMPRLRAAIASGTYDEPIDYYLGGSIAKASFAPRGWGPLPETADRWREFSVTLNADRVRAPLLINAADHEMLSAIMPVRALEDAGRAVEMYVFPDEYHNKWQPAHRLAIYERNIDWMNFWLRGVEDPDPVKAPQYDRWRAMREKSAPALRSERNRAHGA